MPDFDALVDSPDYDARYSAFVDWLIRHHARRLQVARVDRSPTTDVLAAYVRAANDANLSRSEAVDFFCVSDDCVLSAASIDGAEADELVAIFDELMKNWRLPNSATK